MRKIHVAVSVAAAALLSVSCTDRGPTGPSQVRQVARAKNAVAPAPGTCITLQALLLEADAVFGQKSPNSNSVRGKIDLIAKAVAKGDLAQARDHAFKTVAFVLKQAKDKKGLPGTPAQVASLTNHIFCYAGLGIAIEDPQNTVIVDPSSTAQIVTNAAATAGVSFPAGALTETTVLEFVPLPDASPLDGIGPLLTKLDQYPGFFSINASSATNAPLALPVVVGVCPAPGIDPLVRQRLRLGHQMQPDSAHFEITPPADASFLQCPTQTASVDAPSGWLRTLTQYLLPRTLNAAPHAEFSGGVGGTAGEFSPFGPVDLELSFMPGGVGGTAGEFIRTLSARQLSSQRAPSSAERSAPTPKTSPNPQETSGSGVRLLNPGGSCASVDAPWGTPVDTACRPLVTVTTHLGTPLAGVPVTWSINQGGGKVAVPGVGTCGTYADSVVTPTDATGKARVCWQMGDIVGTNNNKVVGRPHAGGQAPVGVIFVPPSVLFTASSLDRTTTWTGATGANWSTAGNWSPARVPTALDSVFIPLTANQPVLSADDTIRSLALGSGASLDVGTFTLTVLGSIDAGNTIVGSIGAVVAQGDGRLRGTFAVPLTQHGTHTMSGPLTVTHPSGLTIMGTMRVGGFTLTTTALVVQSSAGSLVMDNASDQVSVAGNAGFGAGTSPLSRGVLDVKGDLTIDIAGQLLASGSHLTRLSSALAAQTLSVLAGGSTFQDLEFANAGAKSITAHNNHQLRVNGTLTVQSTSPVVAGTHGVNAAGVNADIVSIQGALVDPVGDRLQVADIYLGAVTSLPTRITTGTLVFQRPYTLTDALAVNGNVDVTGAIASLALGGNCLRVTGFGAFGTFSGGRLVMQHPLDSLVVGAGGAAFHGGVSTLTAGTIVSAGRLMQGPIGAVPASPQAFAATGTHRTVFNGPSAAMSFADPGYAQSHFAALVIDTLGVVKLGSHVFAEHLATAHSRTRRIGTDAVGVPRILTTKGLDVDTLVSTNVSIAFEDGGTFTRFQNVTFQGMDPASTPLTVRRLVLGYETYAFPNIHFLTAPSTGSYVRAENPAPNDGSNLLTLFLSGVLPTSHGGFVQVLGATNIIWTP